MSSACGQMCQMSWSILQLYDTINDVIFSLVVPLVFPVLLLANQYFIKLIQGTNVYSVQDHYSIASDYLLIILIIINNEIIKLASSI